MMESLTIGKVAGRIGVGIETIRYYEHRGLIEPPPRSDSGYRQYPEATVQRLRFIRRAKKLGFSLKEIKELLSLQSNPQTTCADIQQRAELKLADIHQRIADLEKMANALDTLVTACSADATSGECPILQALTEDQPDTKA